MNKEKFRSLKNLFLDAHAIENKLKLIEKALNPNSTFHVSATIKIHGNSGMVLDYFTNNQVKLVNYLFEEQKELQAELDLIVTKVKELEK